MISRVRLMGAFWTVGLAATLVLWGAIHAAGGGPARAAAAATVTIENFAFSPATLQVAAGTTVTWTNKDSAAHTVTSDTGAWTDSGSLATGKVFSYTFTKSGSYPYHCAIHPSMTAQVVVGASPTAAPTQGTGQSGMGSMGPMSTVQMHAFTGYYDMHTVRYLSTDSSSKAEAARNHINYAPVLAKALPQTNAIYLIMNGAFAARGPVFGSIPGDAGYSPLWQEVQVSWKNPAGAVALGSDDQIKGLVKAGKLSLTMSGTVLNCPILAGTMAGM